MSLDLIPFIDYTRLNDEDNEQAVAHFCKQAITPHGNVAAICVYAKYIKIAKTILSPHQIPCATVVNFPEGNYQLAQTLTDIDKVLALGADEIDIVIPYQHYFNSNTGEHDIIAWLSQIKQRCQSYPMKVIIESHLHTTPQIKLLCDLVINSGAHFIKTSTGKTNGGASLAAAKTICQRIAFHNSTMGIKVSGGIKTANQALQYYQLIKAELGDNWLHPSRFRIGASQLLDNLLCK